jgi:V/A-type H+-transporting ATPase subunit I
LVQISSRLFSQPKLVLLGMAPEAAKSLADKNQQVFCFILALIQLSVAHITCTIAHRKSLKCLGDFGSLLQLWGTFYVVLSMVVADGVNYVFPLMDNGQPVNVFGWMAPSYFPTACLGLLGFGFMLNFIFSNYEGSVGKSILESLKNIISVFLGIVNVFSDIVSYIRLWAVALAGAAISGTVNAMAGPMFGKLTMMVFGVILLVFGHGLNMILNLLSVIVHGVRLNTLEFSQHLGMAWSGTKYRPFAESESAS